MANAMTVQDYCQLYRLLDRLPCDGWVQSEHNALGTIWEIIRGKLIELGLDPDDVVMQEDVGDFYDNQNIPEGK